jgi:hypothetical protein
MTLSAILCHYMSQSYIHIARTPGVEKVLSDLRDRFSLLNEAEIIRLALSEVHNKEMEAKLEQEQKIREAFRYAVEEGGKRGDEILAQMGLKRETMSEQAVYDALFKNTKQPAKNSR